MSELQRAIEALRNVYGERVKVVVQVGFCDCPTPGCDGLLDTRDFGDPDDAAWCEECGEWEGNCRDLVEG